jgi:hypothetical protein
MTTRYLRIVAVISPSVHLPTIVPVEPTPATLRHNPVDHRNTRDSHWSWGVGRSGGGIRRGRRWWSMSSRSGRRRSRNGWKIQPTNARPPSVLVSGNRRSGRRSLSRSRSFIASMIAIIAAVAIILIVATNINTSRRLRCRLTSLLRRLQLGSKLRRRLLRLLGPQTRRAAVTAPSTAIGSPRPSASLLHRSSSAEHVEFFRSRAGFLRVVVSGAALSGARDEDRERLFGDSEPVADVGLPHLEVEEVGDGDVADGERDFGTARHVCVCFRCGSGDWCSELILDVWSSDALFVFFSEFDGETAMRWCCR